MKAYSARPVKNDVRDAADLADLLRMGRLPEAWIAPPFYRQLRGLTRYRRKLTGLRTSFKDQVHAVLATLGIAVTCSDLFGKWGSAWLDELALPQPYAGKVASLRGLIVMLDGEIAALTTAIAQQLDGHRGYAAIQELPGKLCCWAGLTPRHRESDTKVRSGHVTKQGPRQLRWALCEAVQHQPDGFGPKIVKDSIIARRGKEAKNIAKVAAARELLTLANYGLRDGRIRCLSLPAPVQAP